MSLPDAHNHLHELDGTHRTGRCVTNGTSPADWPAVATLAGQEKAVTPSFGLHPWFISDTPAGWEQTLARLLDTIPHAGVGECGLDKTSRSPPLQTQEYALRTQIHLATSRGRPLSLHCVRAWGRLLEILRSEPLPPQGFLLHGYTGPPEMVSLFAGLGAYFSFSSAQKPKTICTVPKGRLLFESDAGRKYPHRLSALPIQAESMAVVLGVSQESLEKQILENFVRLFGI